MKKSIVIIISFMVIMEVLYPLAYSQSADGSFEISQKLVQAKLKVGEKIIREIKVLNKLPDKNSIDVSLEGLNNSAFLDKASYAIDGHAEETIKMHLSSPSQGIYAGALAISDGKTKKSLPIIIEVESEKPRQAAKIEIPAEFRSAEAGKEIAIRLSILSLDGGEMNALVKYRIMDFSGGIVFKDEEKINFNSTTTIIRRFPLPSTLAKGDYVITAAVSDENSTSTATRVFSVQEQHEFIPAPLDFMIYILMGLVVATVIVLYLNYGRLVKIEKKRPRAGKIRVREKIIRERVVKIRVEGHNPKIEEAKYKLRKQMDSLEKAYKAGYVSEGAYLKSKKSLENAYRQADKRFKRG